MSLNIKPVVLCGGFGARLWPLSRESFSKQFVPLIDGRSLLGLTIDRVKSIGSSICVTNDEHRFFVQELLKESSDHLIVSIEEGLSHWIAWYKSYIGRV
jgi:mannose-1-phosphate guanylyltransferase/mannose-6-phosphate isomerase